MLERVEKIAAIAASVATVGALIFAGIEFQNTSQELKQTRAVRVAQAKLDAIEKLQPRYSWQTEGVRMQSVELRKGKEVSFKIKVNVFNEAGLTYRLYTPIYLCKDGKLALQSLSDFKLKGINVTFPEDYIEAQVEGSEVRLPKGETELTFALKANIDAPLEHFYIDFIFGEISLPSRIRNPISEALQGYAAEDFLRKLQATEALSVRYDPDAIALADFDNPCFGTAAIEISTLRKEVLASPDRWRHSILVLQKVLQKSLKETRSDFP